MPFVDLPAEDWQGDVNATSISTVQTEQTVPNRTCPCDDGVHLRVKLRFFLMTPCWKWRLKRQCPWKAWFQFMKMIIVTTQVSCHS